MNSLSTMMKHLFKVLFLSLVFLVLISCQQEKKKEKEISQFADPNLVTQVGDILPNSEIDGDFQNCNIGLIPQYYAYDEKPFAKGKLDFERYIRQNYKAPENSKESGLLRIRFVVNCKGKSGRFRLLAMNEIYEPMDFSSSISDLLLKLTKEYKEWRVLSKKGLESDYYFYVIFKINQGKIVEVLP